LVGIHYIQKSQNANINFQKTTHLYLEICFLAFLKMVLCEALAWKSKAVQQQTTVILKKPSHDVVMGRFS
jgi:hypothetical protein